MRRTLHRTSEPSSEILTPQEVKTFLKEDLSLNDEMIEELVITSREWLEDETGLNFGLSGYRVYLESFIDIVIPRYPLVDDSVVITYHDSTGTEQTLSDNFYDVIDEEIPCRLKFKGSLPDLMADKEYTISVSFEAGYTKEKTPKRAFTAMKLLVTHYFNHRDLSDKRVDYNIPIPNRVRHFVNPLKKWRLL